MIERGGQPGWAITLPEPVRYADGVRIQEALVEARLSDLIPDVVLFLEHLPVVTLGSRGRDNYLISSPEALAEAGIDLVHSSRGGDVTYHGPGQIVMYPIIRLGDKEADTHGYLHNLEDVAIRTAADFGIDAARREGMTGAWDASGKFAAIGVRFRRWVTFHGMSLNVDMDLRAFDVIVPCGLEGQSVASLQSILGEACPDRSAVIDRMLHHFSEVCARSFAHVAEEGALPEAMQACLKA